MSILEDIKSIAHKISEGYVLFGKEVNSSIESKYNSGEIQNKEILKRVCELVNQNIYLSLFNNNDVDNSNIAFNYADYDKIVDDVDIMEESMSDYDMSPVGFKAEKTASLVKVASLNKVAEVTGRQIEDFNGRIDNIVSNLECVEVDSIKTAEQSYINMKNDAKAMCFNGDSIDDLAKVAVFHAADMSLGYTKVASAYNIINKELTDSGAAIPTGFTKVAEQEMDWDADFFEPIEKFAMSIEVMEASKEMAYNIARIKQ